MRRAHSEATTMGFTDFRTIRLENPGKLKPNKVKQRIYKNFTTDQEYKILNYDKTALCFDDPEKHTNCRSVILAHPDTCLISYSPAKSIELDVFCKTYPSLMDETVRINEFIEGTMIHLFFDKRINSWEIATKSAVGGSYYIFNKKQHVYKKRSTLRDMFLDAMRVDRGTDINQIPGIEYLLKAYSYSMVLQHPENRILLNITAPLLYLVAVYDLMPYSMEAISIPYYLYENWSCFSALSMIQFPRTFEFKTYCEITDSLFQMGTPYFMGYMITHMKSNKRCAIRNKLYDDTLKSLTMDPEVEYKYLCLKWTGHDQNYLNYFPKDKRAFQVFHEQYKSFIENIHLAYLNKYIYKKEVPYHYLPYINQIHKDIFLSKKRKREPITHKVVRDYVWNMEPARLLFRFPEGSV
jgi:hypothetical protein